MSPVDALMAEYAAAVLARDATRLGALYAHDVRVFDAWGVWSHDRQAWVLSLQNWLGSLGDDKVRVEFSDVLSAEQSETGWLNAIVSYSDVDPAGQTLRSMDNRLSWTLAKRDGRWMIVHEHTSAPIDLQSQKALLNRA